MVFMVLTGLDILIISSIRLLQTQPKRLQDFQTSLKQYIAKPPSPIEMAGFIGLKD